MESVYHIVAIRVNETSWAHVWRLRSHYLGTGYDRGGPELRVVLELGNSKLDWFATFSCTSAWLSNTFLMLRLSSMVLSLIPKNN
jgi:hypothetical protein